MIVLKVICISGHAQHGKDTTAQMMRKYLWGFGKRVLIIHYADLLKFICKQFFGWNGEKDDRGRTLLQHVGTEVVRAKCEDFWVDFVGDVLGFFDDTWDYVLIPDCRFPNEISEMRAMGFDVIHVNVLREGYDNGLSEEQLNHPSETALDGVAADHIILNNGTLVDLTREVINFMRPIYAAEEGKIDGRDHLYDIA